MVLETCISGVDAYSLSLRDNALESELFAVVQSVSQMRYLTRLDLSGSNFPNLKRGAKNATLVSNVLLEIVKLIGEEDSVSFFLWKFVLPDYADLYWVPRSLTTDSIQLSLRLGVCFEMFSSSKILFFWWFVPHVGKFQASSASKRGSMIRGFGSIHPWFDSHRSATTHF